MGLIRNAEVRPLESVTMGAEGGTQFYAPQTSHETMMLQMPPLTVEDLFVHHFQTDQLLVVRGNFVLVILRDRSYEYIPLVDSEPTIVTIPPGIPHGGINLNVAPCVIVNAVLRHGTPHPRDYNPIEPPFPYDLDQATATLVGKLQTVQDKSAQSSLKMKESWRNLRAKQEPLPRHVGYH